MEKVVCAERKESGFISRFVLRNNVPSAISLNRGLLGIERVSRRRDSESEPSGPHCREMVDASNRCAKDEGKSKRQHTGQLEERRFYLIEIVKH